MVSSGWSEISGASAEGRRTFLLAHLSAAKCRTWRPDALSAMAEACVPCETEKSSRVDKTVIVIRWFYVRRAIAWAD